MSTNALYRITWGDRIRRIRIQHGLDQRGLAQLLGVSPAAVGQWEKGDHTPRSHTLIEYAVEARLGREAAEFLRGTGFTSTGFAPGAPWLSSRIGPRSAA